MRHVIDPTDASTRYLDADLLDKARRLKEAPFFVNPSDRAELIDKQQIFLVLAGYKPVSEVASGHWVEVRGGRRTVADDPEKIGAFLQTLGLVYHLSNFDDHATDAVVALTPELIEQYVHASGTSRVGKLFGYPETAVRAFAIGEHALLTLDEQEEREREAGLPDGLTMFRLSQDHWEEELMIVKQWYGALREAQLVED